MIELTAADGHKFSAHREDPQDAPKGAVVVLQELFGVDAHIRKMTANFAALGYVAIAPALFDRVKTGVELGYDEAGLAEGLALKEKIDVDAALSDIQAAVDAVKDVGKVAIVGYCWGGYLAYLATNRLSNVACSIGYYGAGIVDGPSAKSKIPTLLHFCEEDPLIPAEEVVYFRANRPDVSVFTYAAEHGFNCEGRSSYNAEAAAKAQERTDFWISQYVVGQPPVLLKNAGFYAAAKPVKAKKKATASADGPPE